jgi:hypothetical protein
MAFLSGVIALLATGGLIWQSSKSHVVPFVVVTIASAGLLPQELPTRLLQLMNELAAQASSPGWKTFV